MADIAMDGIELEEPKRKKVLGILNIKELGNKIKGSYDAIKEGIETRVDAYKTKKAEKKYDKIRDKLVYAGTNYSEKQFKEYQELAEKAKNMTPIERRRYLESVMKSKKKTATIGVVSAITSSAWSLGDAICVAATTTMVEGEVVAGTGIINTTLAALGLAGLPWTALITASLAVAGFTVAMIGLKKSMKARRAEQALSSSDFLKEFENLAQDVAKLKEALDQSRAEWVQKAKTMKTKEYKAAYAAFVEETVARLGLTTIDVQAIQEVFGKGKKAPEKQESAVEDDAPETEDEVEVKTEDGEGELTEDQKKQQEEQRRLAEEQRVREEEARKKAEEENAVEEERE